MTTKVSIPAGVVDELKRRPEGINPYIEELKGKHRINCSFDGNILELHGQHDEILDLANEHLHRKVGRAPASKWTLGDNGTVNWSSNNGKRISYLFENDLKLFLDEKSLKQTIKEDIIVFTLNYDDYKNIKSRLDDLGENVKACKNKDIKLERKEQSIAKSFHDYTDKNKWYCVHNTSQNKLTIYGRTDKDCEDGVLCWENFKKKGQKQSNTVTPRSVFEETSNTGPMKTTEEGNSRSTKSSEGYNAKQIESDWEKTVSAKSVSSNQTSDLKMSVSKSTNNNQLSKSEIADMASSSQKSVRMSLQATASGDNKTIKKTTGTITGSGEAAKYTFRIEDITFHIYKQSITEIKGMDAITNAANDRLMHGGGVAYYISKAAGKKMDQDCYSYIEKNGVLPVTTNYVSIPGDIKCKGIIHAVGPTWYDYRDRENECARDLYETIKNILITANDRKYQKVALSAISSGLFGVPKKLCAEMYIKAFADYVYENPHGKVKEVHFIDVSREILDIVIDAHKLWLDDDTKLDFNNALLYPSSTSKTKTRKGTVLNEHEELVQAIGTAITSYGQTIYKYRLYKKLAVCVYQGSLKKIETVDAIALMVSPDPGSMGVFETSVRNFADYKYQAEVDKYRNGKNGKIFVTKAGGLKCKNIVHIISHPVRRVDDKSLSIYGSVLTHKYSSKIRSIGMPLFGTGSIRNKADIDFLCYNVIQVLIGVCMDNSNSLQVEELHLVNLDPDISSRMKDVFITLSSGKEPKQFEKNPSFSDTSYTGDNTRGKTESQSWVQHTRLEDSASDESQLANGKDKKMKSLTLDSAPSGGICEYCSKSANRKVVECGHMFCKACSITMEKSKICLKCSKDDKLSSSKTCGEKCPVCLESFKIPKVLPCNHKLCSSCYERVREQKPQCPTCQHIFGIIRGTQPDGKMFYRYRTWKTLPGFESYGTIEIYYIIYSGKQTKNHPNPGKPYIGVERFAYLPNNEEGNRILYLLRKAFDRRLIFTIGESRTTGKEDVVTWNDIHHKTKQNGGPERFGYPDPTYLSRVREELADKGVTG